MDYSYSSGLFQEEADFSEKRTFARAKLEQICDLLKKIIKIPFCACAKVFRTVFHVFMVAISMVPVIASLGVNEDARIHFTNRMVILAEDLADWLLYPFAISIGLAKAVLQIFFTKS